MKMFVVDLVVDNAVHCDTEEKANELMQWAHKHGFRRWHDGGPLAGWNNFNRFKKNTCFFFTETTVALVNLERYENGSKNKAKKFEDVLIDWSNLSIGCEWVSVLASGKKIKAKIENVCNYTENQMSFEYVVYTVKEKPYIMKSSEFVSKFEPYVQTYVYKYVFSKISANGYGPVEVTGDWLTVEEAEERFGKHMSYQKIEYTKKLEEL